MKTLLCKLHYLFILIAFASAPSWAHQLSDSYLQLNEDHELLQGKLQIAVKDLEMAIGLDGNADGNITWGEIRVKQVAIDRYILSRLTVTQHLSVSETECQLTPQTHQIEKLNSGVYLLIPFMTDCNNNAANLEIKYNLLFDINPSHRSFITRITAKNTATKVVSPQAPLAAFNADTLHSSTAHSNTGSWQENFSTFVREGIWHIWNGIDHILFLSALLLPAVFRKTPHGWQTTESLKMVFKDVFAIVTAFTLAHSITLTAASLKLIELPTAVVESAIAFSVGLAGINVLYPIFGNRRWQIALAFGLIHGFGFASALQDLTLPEDSYLLCLIGFNVGVELGQMAIVMVLLPSIYLIRATNFYQRFALPIGAYSIATIGFLWTIERWFGVTFIA